MRGKLYSQVAFEALAFLEESGLADRILSLTSRAERTLLRLASGSLGQQRLARHSGRFIHLITK